MNSLIFQLFAVVFLVLPFDGSESMDYTYMSGNALSRAADEIGQKFGMRCVSSGGGAMDVVRTLHFAMETDETLTIENGRQFAVEGVAIFLKHLNSYKELRPFLIEYPMTPERISISFIARTKDSNDKSPDSLADVMAVKGNIVYFREKKGTLAWEESLKESLEEARKILQQQGVDANQRASSNPNLITVKPTKNELPTLGKIFQLVGTLFSRPTKEEKYFGPAIERKMLWDLDSFGKKIAEKHGMVFHRAGDPTEIPNNNIMYGLIFFDDHMKSLQEGRLFAASFMEEFVQKLHGSSTIKSYHEYYNERFKNWKGFPPFTPEPVPEQMCLKIGYWDDKFDRPQKPLLAEILFVEGFFHYYEADPETLSLKLVLKESYADGMKFLKAKQNG